MSPKESIFVIRYLFVLMALFIGTKLNAQISFHTAIDLSLRNSPRVKMAENDVAKSTAILDQSKNVYIPALSVGSGLYYTYGFPIGQPTILSVNIQSLVFDQSQKNYTRAAYIGLEAANFALADARQVVAEDAALAYIALDYDLQRLTALQQQNVFAARLTDIVQSRLDAGQDNPIELTRSHLTATQIRLARLHGETDAAYQRQRLAHLTGLPAGSFSTIHGSIPVPPSAAATAGSESMAPAISAAYASARSKFQVAFGDARKLYRPQVGFGAQYSRFAPFNHYERYYQGIDKNPDNASFGIQLTIPLFNASVRAKARESLADAEHAQHDADRANFEFMEGRVKLQNSIPELALRVEIATLDQQLAQQQLDSLQIQLAQGSGGPAAPPTPKEEQNSSIQERQKYLDYLAANLQLLQTQISALRLSGQLEGWLKSTFPAQNLHGGQSEPSLSPAATPAP